MSFEGANPEELDTLAGQFETAAQRLDDIRTSLSRRLAYSTWRGHGADRFRHQWTSSAHTLSFTSAALREARGVLQTNANQQRHASGEATVNYSPESLIGGLIHRTESLVHSAEKLEHNIEHIASNDFKEFVAVSKADLREVVSSPVFKDVMEASQIVSAVLPIVAVFIPAAAPALLAIAAVAATVVFIGDAMQMANSGKWDVGKLAEDGVVAGLGFAGAGAFGAIAKGGADMNLASRLGQNVSDFAKPQQAIVVLRSAKAGYDMSRGTYNVTSDLVNHQYTKAAEDSSQIVDVADDLLGAGHVKDSMIQKLSSPVEHAAVEGLTSLIDENSESGKR